MQFLKFLKAPLLHIGFPLTLNKFKLSLSFKVKVILLSEVSYVWSKSNHANNLKTFAKASEK